MSFTDQEYADALCLLRGRLDRKVADELDSGDFATNLLKLLRDRPEPPLLFTPERLPEIAETARAADPDEADWERTIADNAIEWRLNAASNAHCDRFPEIDPETFDWSAFEHADKEALHGLNRLRWFRSFVWAYWETRDRDYFDALMEHWDVFVRQVPFPGPEFSRQVHAIGPVNMAPPWGELDTFIRLTNWYWGYWLSLYAPEMTAERNVVNLARCLRLFDVVAARGIRRIAHNFTSMQMEALYLWAASLPEFSGMDTWRNAARNTMESSMAHGVFEDGVQWEKSAGYHSGCIRWYGTSLLLGRRIGDEWAPAYDERLRKMAAYTDAILTPDGKIPLLSDSDRGSGLATLAIARSVLPDLTFRRPVPPRFYSVWISDGLTWDAADVVEKRDPVDVFDDGGVAVVRSGASAEAPMVIFDNGPTDAGHSHFDNLTVHFDLPEGPVIVDPGRATYTPGPDRAWVVSAESHNTVYIEDEPVEAEDWIRERAFDVIAGPADNRAGPLRVGEQHGATTLRSVFRGHAKDPNATARRTVIMPNDPEAKWLAVVDEIEGPEPHNWTHSWLFPAAKPGRVTDTGYDLDLDSGFTLRFAFIGDTLLALRDEAKFWCPNYAEKSPARWVRFTSHCDKTRRAFLFVPQINRDLTPDLDFTRHGVMLHLGREKVEFALT